MKKILLVLATLSLLAATAARAQRVATTNPHGALPQPCAACHAPEGWVPARISSAFDHAKTGFALAGSHARATCRSCHSTLDFKGAATTCSACHEDIHRGELGADCSRCHTTRSFLDRAQQVRAHQETRFPLTGSHIALDCERCHTPTPQGQMAFVNRSVDCVSCHRANYLATTTPNHQAGAISTNCNECHSTTLWSPARFNHAGTGFPLTGAHVPLACNQCHGDGIYAGKNAACVSCHQQAYDATTDPGHAAAGFATTCQDCHSTSGWTGASFNHTWFRVPHRTATDCSDCHTDRSNFSVFVCTVCHTQTETASNHRGVGGYVWNSTNCYGCHRR